MSARPGRKRARPQLGESGVCTFVKASSQCSTMSFVF
jgi:hypothetical protein